MLVKPTPRCEEAEKVSLTKHSHPGRWADQIGEPEVPLCWVLPLPNSIFLQVNKDYLKLVTLTKRVTSVAGISGIANMLVEKIRRKAYLQKSHFIPLNQQNVSAFVCHPLSSSTLGQLLPSC